MTGVNDERFPKSLIQADRIVTDTKWNTAENGSTPFSDFFGVAMLSKGAVTAALTTRRATPFSGALHLPLVFRRRSKTRLWTGGRLLSWG
ncbi:hypothetical protein JMM63_14300 [Rhodovulum sulfidophilum]|uniref:Probable cytosol aminopeptidase n=1 Tax=Rhodovulum sulfidophilum TaxID=35806 RepID=A0A0D6B0Y1_RHOSU|nr:hypothetical protein [Rhodovulum sulfidophilum]ANB35314.1 hypothetical protein A6W98_15295 [Rhodovulum sulfidophilum DSM 1374]ANB39136.1 hypothetical protein A6024_15160 [Rhodovulum sulfidophilum]MBL3561035.1 hypothetical protein [Rhodovulum sulfidophilum]MBL3566010.1 hypothetical protein [Rhodovulum sulfidophilum]MBL3575367.1 hypothetical protein [Rhodovulum sulfidophilum]